MKADQPAVILGIDPGTTVMGYAVIAVLKKGYQLIDIGEFTFRKYLTHHKKLQKIYEEVDVLIEKHRPDELAIESPFYSKNPQSTIKLGRAQGVAIAVGLSKGLRISEYSPKKIKQSITGNGNASKVQLSKMLENLVDGFNGGKSLDASDALAVAVCHHFQANSIFASKRAYSGWASYVKENPDKIS
jgi:crossover junction endodeoxyribonuclease RuvC